MIFLVAVSVLKKRQQKKKKKKAESEGGSREGERLWLLDLFLWLRHVVVEGS